MKDFKLYTIKDKDFWIDDFNNKLQQIAQSSDPKKNNYLPKNFNLNDQIDMSVIYYDNDLVAFSTIWRSDLYPESTYRILNRSWKDPSIRWGKPAYYILSQLMVGHQIQVCRDVNAKCVFVSSEGRRSLWLKKWIQGANADGYNFKQIHGMVKVCGGSYLKCWQNVGYMNLSDSKPDFELVDYDTWELMVEYDK